MNDRRRTLSGARRQKPAYGSAILHSMKLIRVGGYVAILAVDQVWVAKVVVGLCRTSSDTEPAAVVVSDDLRLAIPRNLVGTLRQ